MPGTRCSVAICTSNYSKAKQLGDTISFFSFPKDKELRKEWIRNCYGKDKFDPKNKLVCYKHFKEDNVEDSMEAKLMGKPAKKFKKM